jgi:hypothetical protein
VRFIEYSILAILFVIDNITTYVARNLGYPELNENMIPFVDNVILFLLIKGLVFIVFVCLIELLVKYVKKENSYSRFWQFFFFIAILFGILLYVVVVVGNISVIFRVPNP